MTPSFSGPNGPDEQTRYDDLTADARDARHQDIAYDVQLGGGRSCSTPDVAFDEQSGGGREAGKDVGD